MSLAIVPGSFDPMTLGHLAVIRRAAAEYDKVVVAVMVNAEKSYLFSMEERVAIARKTVAGLANVRVLSDAGYLIDLFDRLGADAVCKGYRNAEDLAYEQSMDAWNRAHNPRFITKLYPSEEGLHTVSSTEVRERLERGEVLEDLIAPAALPLVEARRAKQTKYGGC